MRPWETADGRAVTVCFKALCSFFFPFYYGKEAGKEEGMDTEGEDREYGRTVKLTGCATFKYSPLLPQPAGIPIESWQFSEKILEFPFLLLIVALFPLP
jgi:hypothetical protein